mmetsp:Transcript_20816/g.57933  ORF Transcript_20816/g.57933 Transcript_20816/m.57933 type:complete len:209 (-) Transcript_20816:342-968(-)
MVSSRAQWCDHYSTSSCLVLTSATRVASCIATWAHRASCSKSPRVPVVEVHYSLKLPTSAWPEPFACHCRGTAVAAAKVALEAPVAAAAARTAARAAAAEQEGMSNSRHRGVGHLSFCWERSIMAHLWISGVQAVSLLKCLLVWLSFPETARSTRSFESFMLWGLRRRSWTSPTLSGRSHSGLGVHGPTSARYAHNLARPEPNCLTMC